MATVERAMIDGAADGFVALYTHDGIIVGATFVAAHAGESLPLLTLAVMQRMTPAGLAAVDALLPRSRRFNGSLPRPSHSESSRVRTAEVFKFPKACRTRTLQM